MSYLGLEQQLIQGITDNYRKYEYSAIQGQTSFTVNLEYDPYKLLIYINGYLVPENEYTITDNSTYFELTFDESLNQNDSVVVISFGSIESMNVGVAVYTEEYEVLTNENTFSVTFSTDIRNNSNHVYYNGIRLQNTDYSINANTFTLNTITSANDIILLESFISDNVVPEYRKVDVTPFVAGTYGVPTSDYNGGGLALRRIKTTNDITATLNSNHEIELNFNSSPISVDTYTANGNISVFNLQYQTVNSYTTLVTVDGIVQTPEVHYQIDIANSQIIFGSNPPNNSLISVVYLQNVSNTTTLNDVSDNTISTNKIQNDAVTPEKIKNPWLVKDNSFTAYDGYKYIINATTSNLNVLLPTARNSGDQVSLLNITPASSTNTVTIIPSVFNNDTLENKTSALMYGESTSFDLIFNGTQWITANKNLNWKTINSTTILLNFGKFFVDTSSASFTVNLPSNPMIGEEVIFFDIANTWDTNNLIIDGNGKNIDGQVDYIADVEGGTVHLVYTSNLEWKPLSV